MAATKLTVLSQNLSCMECLNVDVKKKKDIVYIRGRTIQIATSSNLFDTKYEFYAFNDDLRETIN